MVRVLLRNLAAGVAVVVSGSLLAAPASAASTPTRSFMTTMQFYSSDLKRCAKVTITGTLEATPSDQTLSMGGHRYQLSKVRLKNPKVNLNVYSDCYSTTAKTVDGVTFSQQYYSTQCEVNTSFGVGISTSGFSASVSATPKCKEVTVAKRSSNYRGTKDSSYQQSNTGTTITWEDSKVIATTKKISLCIQPMATLRMYIGTKDDGGTLTYPEQCVSYST